MMTGDSADYTEAMNQTIILFGQPIDSKSVIYSTKDAAGNDIEYGIFDYRDQKIKLSNGTFIDPETGRYHNPSYLAYALDHEDRHFTQYKQGRLKPFIENVKRRDSPIRYNGKFTYIVQDIQIDSFIEAEAYKESLKVSSLYGLSHKDYNSLYETYTGNLKNLISENKNVINSGKYDYYISIKEMQFTPFPMKKAESDLQKKTIEKVIFGK